MRRFALLACVVAFGCEAFEVPEGVDISIDAPLQVTVDQEFEVVLNLTNTSAQEQTLVDVDIADEFLEGIVVSEMDPAFSDAAHIPIDNTQSYSLDLVLPPGQEVSVTISAFAAHAGDWAGDIDFCINSAVSCLSYPVRTIVR